MAFAIRPVTGFALREALKSRLVARAPDPDAVLAWNTERRRLLSSRDDWANPPDLVLPRANLCVIGSLESDAVPESMIATEIVRRGYLLVDPEHCDIISIMHSMSNRKAKTNLMFVQSRALR